MSFGWILLGIAVIGYGILLGILWRILFVYGYSLRGPDRDDWWQQQDTDEQWRRHHERLDENSSGDSRKPRFPIHPPTKDIAGNPAPF